MDKPRKNWWKIVAYIEVALIIILLWLLSSVVATDRAALKLADERHAALVQEYQGDIDRYIEIANRRFEECKTQRICQSPLFVEIKQ